MNILTAVIVESTASVGAVDRELMIEEELLNQKSYSNRLKEFLLTSDIDGDGKISQEELESHLASRSVQGYLQCLQVPMSSVVAVFKLLSRDDLNHGTNPEIEIEAFVNGLLYYNGPAQHIDVAAAYAEVQNVRNLLKAMVGYFDGQFHGLNQHIHRISDTFVASQHRIE